MAFSEELAQLLRDELAGMKGLTEKKMFGGLCLLVGGHMICGVHQGGGMARVGKDQEAEALKFEGVAPLSFTGRRMGGMVDLSEAAIRDKKTRRAVLSLAKKFVHSLPPKE